MKKTDSNGNDMGHSSINECMRIQIVEDVSTIADRIERLTREILDCYLLDIQVSHSLDCALQNMKASPTDLVFLDLNLHGENGFILLQDIVAEPFHTIIISAYAERAITAFEHGVLDFIKKPFSKERLEKAIVRFLKSRDIHSGNDKNSDSDKPTTETKFLSVREEDVTRIIPTKRILRICGAGGYSEIHTVDGKSHIHCKSLGNLMCILPSGFERVHKSHVVQTSKIHNIEIVGDHKYQVDLGNGTNIPVSRNWYKSRGFKLKN